MIEKNKIKKSLTEEIIEEMFKKIEGIKEFNSSTIKELNELAKNKQLTSDEKILKALK